VTESTAAITQQLARIIGGQNVIAYRDLDPLLSHRLHQGIGSSAVPDCIAYPQTQAELSEVVTCAHHYHWRILPWGQGSKISWGGLAQDIHLLVSTERLNRLVAHAAGDLTVTVEAGMGFAALQDRLTAAGQFWGIDPAYPERATVGGIIATADTGSLRHRYGGVRDLCLGVSMVRSDGQIVKAGGRVVKNVAGYDLMKLLTGSFGTLGILVEVTLRLSPLPPLAATVVLAGSVDGIATAASTLLPSTLTPAAMDLLSSKMLSQVGLSGELGLGIRFQALPESVDQQVDRVLEVGKTLGLAAVTFRDSEEAALWQTLGEALWQGEPVILAKCGVLPTQAAPALAQMEAIARQFQVILAGRIHTASGLGMLRLEGDESALAAAVLKLRSLCTGQGGFLTILSAPLTLKQQLDVWGYSGNALGLMQAIKRQFDPHHLLSPGRFIGGI